MQNVYMTLVEKEIYVGISIQPRDIEIPPSNPFKHDLLERRNNVVVLTRILRTIDGPCTISVDAEWGEGKTTFLKMWNQHLKNQDFPVIFFNAWETDYSQDPFIALSDEIKNALDEYASPGWGPKIDTFRRVTINVVKHAAPALIRLGTAGVLDINAITEQEIGNALSSYAENRLSAYRSMHTSIVEFRSNLEDIAQSLSEENSGQPLVIIIDELDRCRPTYAIELLEAAKHLFAADNVMFIFGVNSRQLAHSVRAIYGDSFDGEAYLQRFFHIRYRLPSFGTQNLVTSNWHQLGLDDISENSNLASRQRDINNAYLIFHHFLRGRGVSKRATLQMLQLFNLIILSLEENAPFDGGVAATALLIRTLNFDIYSKFLIGQASDKEVADTLFESTGTVSERGAPISRIAESILMISASRIFGELFPESFDDDGFYRTELYEQYLELRRLANPETAEHANDLVQGFARLSQQYPDFRDASRLIEMTADDFKQD